MNKVNCKYQDQNASMTLAEGIDEYYKANPHLLLPASSDPAAHFFLCHDRIHVIFGCNTSFLHEIRTDFWTLFGSDVGLMKYASYIKSPAIKLLYQDIREKASRDPALRETVKSDIKKSFCSSLLTPFKVFIRTRMMKKKWPWLNSESLLNRSLKDLREEYGIKIFE